MQKYLHNSKKSSTFAAAFDAKVPSYVLKIFILAIGVRFPLALQRPSLKSSPEADPLKADGYY